MNELLLPSETVALLRSKDSDEKMRGILESGRHIKAYPVTVYESRENFNRATLPRRLYDMIFDDDVRVARQAALTLVSNANSYKDLFADVDDYDATSIDVRRLFAEKLVEFLGKNNLAYLVDLEVRRTSKGAHISVDLTRRLRFEINGVHPLLPRQREYSHTFFHLSTPFGLYGDVTNVIRKPLTEPESGFGYILRAEGDIEPLKQPPGESEDEIGITVHYQHSVGTVKTTIAA